MAPNSIDIIAKLSFILIPASFAIIYKSRNLYLRILAVCIIIGYLGMIVHFGTIFVLLWCLSIC
jgi:hypothetical protein